MSADHNNKNHQQEKGNGLVLFIFLAFIGYVVYYVFVNEYYKGNFLAKTYPEVKETISEVKEVKKAEFSLFAPSAKSMAKGKEIYETTCKSCHGAEGKGDGPAGAALNPKARNFHNAAEYKFGINKDNLLTTVTKGSPGTSMAGFDFLPEDDRIAAVHYISQWITGQKDQSGSSASASSASAATTQVSAVATNVELNAEKVELGLNKVTKELNTVGSYDKTSDYTTGLKMLFSGKLKQEKVAPYANVIVNTKDVDLSKYLISYDAFIKFINSDYVYRKTGINYSTLSIDASKQLYTSVKSN